MNRNIAIDGPAGAGKSTIAKKVAGRLGLVYVDTGAMYRAIGLYMTENGIKASDTGALKTALNGISLDIIYEGGEQQIILNGENVSDLIRTPEIGKAASKFAAIACVREELVGKQKILAKRTAVVMDGRDIGTKVLPDASVKIFLTADVEVRAERRYKELLEKGEKVDFELIKEDIIKRDEQDMNRKESPLVKAEDAVLVDTSRLSIDEATEEIARIACVKNPGLIKGKDDWK